MDGWVGGWVGGWMDGWTHKLIKDIKKEVNLSDI
jgi:hypothetical protein